jgi:hypothetical protein
VGITDTKAQSLEGVLFEIPIAQLVLAGRRSGSREKTLTSDLLGPDGKA